MKFIGGTPVYCPDCEPIMAWATGDVGKCWCCRHPKIATPCLRPWIEPVLIVLDVAAPWIFAAAMAYGALLYLQWIGR